MSLLCGHLVGLFVRLCCSDSHWIVMSRLTWFLAEIEKQATCLFWIRRKFNSSISSSSVSAPSISFLFPRIKRGMPWSVGQSSRVCRLRLASSIVAISTESTTNIITSAYRQYFSQLSRKRSCPPKSHTFSVILPFLTRL